MTLPFSDAAVIEEWPIAIPHLGDNLTGSLGLVPCPVGVVLVANDRGCSRHDPGEHALLAGLRHNGFATVLVDLLLPEEAGVPEQAAWARLRTVELAGRIASARGFVAGRPELSRLPLALFGQGTGAAAAMLSASARPAGVAAVIAQVPLPTGAKDPADSSPAPLFLSSESAPEACALSASAWIRSRIARRIAGPIATPSAERAAALAVAQ